MIHEGHEFIRRAASGPVRSGEVRSVELLLRLVTAGEAVPCQRINGDRMVLVCACCNLRSWFSVSRFSLHWPIAEVDTSVAHLESFCPGISPSVAIIHFLIRHVATLVGRFGPSCYGAPGLLLPGFGWCMTGHGSTIARAAGFCTRTPLFGQFPLIVSGFS